MNSHRSACQRVLTAAIILVTVAGTASFAHAGGPELRVTFLGKQYLMSSKTHGKFVYEGPYGSHLRKKVARKSSTNRAASARREQFNELNLAVNVPSSAWVKLDPAEHGTRACLLLSRRDPDVIVSVAAERVGIEADETNSSLVAASQEKMKSLPGGVVLPGERQLSAAGIDGRTYRASATFDNGTQLHYSMWVATKNGYNYTLAVYGEERHERAIDQTMQQFVGGLRQIQPSRVAHATTEPAVRR